MWSTIEILNSTWDRPPAVGHVERSFTEVEVEVKIEVEVEVEVGVHCEM